MKTDTIGALAAQPDNADNAQHEWASLIETAEAAGLIRPEDCDKVQHLKDGDAAGLLSPDHAHSEVLALLAAGPAPDKALDAIAPLFAPDDVIELRTLPDATSYNGRLSVPSERAEMAAFIRRYIGQANLYFGANPRREGLAGTNKSGNALDVGARRAVFLDLDMKDAPDADPNWTQTVAELEASGAALVVQTGNGYHVWLNLKPLDGEALSASVAPLAAIMARVGSDNVADLPRVARLPYTVNLPNATKRARGNTVALALPVPSTGAAPLVVAPTPTVEALCGAMKAIADRRRLPGRAGASGSSVSNTAGSGGGEKKGWAAPSGELLRMTLEELPNDQGRFDNRDDWVSVCAAAKGAAVEGGFEDAGREVWLDFCMRWGRGDADEDARVWDTMKAPRNGWGTLMKWLEQTNPAGAKRVKDAAMKAAYAEKSAKNLATLRTAAFGPVKPKPPGQIPPRRWLYGRSVVGGYVSMLAAPGGVGKSALLMVEAVAMATGKTLFPDDSPARALRVWLHNAEDDDAEQQRRLAGIMQHYQITEADLDGRLFLTSGRDDILQIAKQGHGGAEVEPGFIEGMIDRIEAHGIDVVIFDPLGAMHSVNENANDAANVVMGALRRVAHETGVGMGTAHHSAQWASQNMRAAGAAAARGATAFVDAARNVRQLIPMDDKTARQYGVPETERRQYFQISNGKANFAALQGDTWCHLASVQLSNGDWVQAAEPWTPPAAAGATTSDLHAAQVAIQAAHDAGTPPVKNVQSAGWVGHAIGAALGINVGTPGTKKEDLNAEEAGGRARVSELIKRWLKDGSLLEYEAPGKGRRPQTFIRIGAPAIVADDADSEDKLPDAA